MRRILIYSDCFVFSGSENVIENILRSEKIGEKYEVSFYYASGKTYTESIKQKFAGYQNIKPVRIFSAFTKWGYPTALRKANKNILYYYTLLRYCISVFFEKIGIYGIHNLCMLLWIFKREKPDIIFINNGGYPGAKSCRVAVLSARWANVKKIIFNVNNLAYPPKNGIDKFEDYWINKFVSVFVTASKAAGEQLIMMRNFDRVKLRNIPNTLSKTLEKKADKMQGCLRKDFNIKKDDIIIGAVGLLTPRKGFHILVEALKYLKAKNNGFKVIIFGEGEQRGLLENKILQLGLEDIISLPGFRSNILAYVKDFDIFVSPSIANEDFPYVIIEAMLFAKPVIGTNIAGIPEQVTDGYNGLIVNAGDAVGLGEAINQLIGNRQVIKEMGRNSYKKYHENYSNDIIMNEYVELFERVDANE